jgi:hypothetical protein
VILVKTREKKAAQFSGDARDKPRLFAGPSFIANLSRISGL